MHIKLTEADLEWSPAKQARQMAAVERLRGPRRAPKRPVVRIPDRVPLRFAPAEVATFRDPSMCRTIYLEPIGPSDRPARTLYPHPIGPTKRDILNVSSGGWAPVPKSSFRQIMDEVCRKYQVAEVDILSHRRPAEIIIPRHEIYYRLRHETNMSFPQMGRMMGGKDHTCAINSVRKYTQLLAEGKVSL